MRITETILFIAMQGLPLGHLLRGSVLYNSFSRHVLQEMTVDTFIPNDTNITREGIEECPLKKPF